VGGSISKEAAWGTTGSETRSVSIAKKDGEDREKDTRVGREMAAGRGVARANEGGGCRN